MQQHPVVSQEEWLAKRRALLAREKEAIHLRDAVNAERQALPWVKVDTQYVFDTLDGKRTLAELFGARSQLMVYHFMLGPGWSAGCHGCSFVADHFDGMLAHLNHHDVTLTAVSRAPLAEIEAYKARMGWRFPWVSSFGSTFNHDYHVSFTPEELAGGDVFYNFTAIPVARPERVLQGRGGQRVPYVFNVCARPGRLARDLPDARPRAPAQGVVHDLGRLRQFRRARSDASWHYAGAHT